MKHEIEHIGNIEKGAVLVWDDEAGALEYVREPDDRPDNATKRIMEGLVAQFDYARENAPIKLPYGPSPCYFELKDPAHDPADFLRLTRFAEFPEDVRLPPSLQGIEPTPLAVPDSYDPHVVY